MWVLSWKKYSLSKLATFVSVIGALTRYAGVTCLFSSFIPAGLICIAIGIGIHFGAEAINKGKVKKLAGKTNAEKPVASKTTATNTATAQPTPNPVYTNPNPVHTNPNPVHTNPNPVYTDPNPIYINPDFVQSSPKAKPVNDVTQTSNLRRPCRNCGNFVLPTSNFCDKCGTKMTKEKKCLRCGYVLGENDKFCSQCGYHSN